MCGWAQLERVGPWSGHRLGNTALPPTEHVTVLPGRRPIKSRLFCPIARLCARPGAGWLLVQLLHVPSKRAHATRCLVPAAHELELPPCTREDRWLELSSVETLCYNEVGPSQPAGPPRRAPLAADAPSML